MMEVYRFQDGKSDKFWRTEWDGADFAMNYGKTGTSGKYQIREFDGAEKCGKEARKLIASKTKKGYQLYAGFDADGHFYFDDEEAGLHPRLHIPRFGRISRTSCITTALTRKRRAQGGMHLVEKQRGTTPRELLEQEGAGLTD
jgi:predicted DNA-binding WGR domain protein